MKLVNATGLITGASGASGAQEVLADDITRQAKQGLAAEPGMYLLPPA